MTDFIGRYFVSATKDVDRTLLEQYFARQTVEVTTPYPLNVATAHPFPILADEPQGYYFIVKADQFTDAELDSVCIMVARYLVRMRIEDIRDYAKAHGFVLYLASFNLRGQGKNGGDLSVSDFAKDLKKMSRKGKS